MDATTFLDNFTTIADTPGGVLRLRGFVRALAIAGHLVPQDTAEEPAEQLLNRIRDERAQMIQRGELRRQADRSHIPVPTLPGWESVTLGDIVDLEYGKPLPAGSRVKSGSVPVFGSNGVVGYHDEALVPTPCVVVGRKGSAGAVTVVDGPSWPIDTTYFVRPRGRMTTAFLGLLLGSSSLDKLDRATAVPGLNREDAYRVPALLPPLVEQGRIVATVGELMTLCDELEARQQRRRHASTHFRTSALVALTESVDSNQAHEAWTRIDERWSTITEDREGLEDLREIILSQAVTGRLVPHLTDDMSLDAVRRPVMVSDLARTWELPFLSCAPESWPRMSMADLGTWGSGGTPAKSNPAYYDGPIPWVVIGDLNEGRVERTNSTITEAGLSASSAKMVPVGSVLIAMYGASIGKTGVTGIECATNQAIAHCVPNASIISLDYLFLLARSLKSGLSKAGKGGAQPNISQTILKGLAVPVPPLADQARIVERYAELMSLCDSLASRLAVQDRQLKRLSAALTSVD